MKGEFIIHFGGNIRGDWETGWQREQELATRISKDNKVLYIERLGSINRNPLDLCRRLWKRVKRNSKVQVSGENLHFYFPFIIPVHGIFFIRKLNSLLLSFQIKRKLRSFQVNGQKPIIWVKNPAEYVLDVLPKLDKKLTIYDCHHVHFFGMVTKGKELDEKMAQAADLVFADSTFIYEGKARLNPYTYHIPQGVNLSLFGENKAKSSDLPQELEPINSPVIGFIGHSHPSFDFDLVSYLADKRPHWSFVLVGNFEEKKAKFNSLSNVYLLGPRKHEELPNYLEHFDVCIIPYLVNEHTKTVFPTKLFEYLACGKPVVSTYMPDLVRYDKFVKIAKDYPEFLTHIENSLEEEKQRNKRTDFYSLIKENTWEKRLDDIYQTISFHLDGKMETLKGGGLPEDSESPPVSKVLSASKNVLLLGFGFYLRRISGDKNFWLGLSKELSAELDKVVIISVNSSPVKFEQEGNIYLYNIQRPLHRKKDDERVLRFQFQKHPLPWEILERSATLLKLIPFLKKIVKLHNIQVIHLMDNFGFLTGLVKVVFPKLPVYATGITYITHGFPAKLYFFYQTMVFGNLDKVVVSSRAYREKLIEGGFPKEKVKVIRWGIPIADGKKRVPEKVKKNPSSRVILWTGFTQQIKAKSFYLSLSIAQNIIRKKSSVDFVFAFKPECFDKRYELFQEKHLQVIATNPEDFLKLLEKVDLLLAPVENFRSIIAPPLTWLECMALGIPIISTQAPGVEEILKHNLSGFVAKSNEELEDLMEKVLEDENLLSEVSTKAKEWVEKKYNLKDIAQDYQKLWRDRW